MSKTSRKISVFMAAVLCLSMVSVFGMTFAGTALADPGDAPAAPAAASQRPKSIPESFNVNTYLKTDDMNSKVPDTSASLADQKQSGGIIKVLLDAIKMFVNIIGSIALIVFIIGALLTVTSSGKEDRLERGKTTMVYAVIGLVVTFLSFMLVALVQSLFF
ncbi:MAG: hypothetical protein WCT53_02500 [Candidatus Gracilibacteria bacterium]